MIVVLWTASCGPGVREEMRDEGRFGAVRVFSTGTDEAGLVFLFSDAAGWRGDLTEGAERVARAGALVVGVDLKSYLEGLRASDDGCHYVVSEIEDLSHRLQRERGFPRYRSPILAGVGAGATLAYAALAQAPAATLDVAISVDPAPAVGTRVPLCAGAPAVPEPGGGFGYGAAAELPAPWWVSATTPLAAPLAAVARASPAPAVRGDAERRLADLAVAALVREAPARVELDLPLVELSARASDARGLMAVVYSGDGGWRDLDKQIAEVLASDGIPVVGVDSLRYFWTQKSPETVGADLARILRHYEARFDARRILLVGYSFGAGILPFAVTRLPADLRAQVVQISLLGLGSRAPFQVSVSGWLGAHDRGLPVLPELERLDLGRVQCFYGEEEEDTLCPSPALEGIERIRTRGGHHFDGDYERLAREILAGAARRSAPSTLPQPPSS